MNEYYYMYTKLRKEFGKHAAFEDTDPKPLGVVEPCPALRDSYVEQQPRKFVSDNIPDMSENSVNTERVSTANKGMRHVEGGWPKEVDASEHQETSKWRKRLDKDPGFASAVRFLCSDTSRYLEQNSTIDAYEEYFVGESVQHSTESLSANTMMLFKDQADDCKRTATTICWHPDGPSKIAVGYSIMRFQQIPDLMPTMAFIWDLSNPNIPASELASVSSVVSLQYNHKNPDIIVGGCYNGLVALWDVRKGAQPVELSRIENSHHDPVYDICWLQSKTSSECVSVSTDGRVLWWDVRNLKEPTDSCELNDGNKDDPKVLGGVSLEWALEAGPTKFLVGTEQGVVLSLNKKPKKAVEVAQRYGMESGRHHGPIYAVKRNPAHPKFFLTVGDWTAKIWMEELKSPIATTQYHPASLMTGQWSPTRAGLFLVCRQDGYLDFWDYFYRQNELSFQHKVGDSALWSVAIQNQGQLVAVGDTDGTVTLLELCDALYIPTPAEKNAVSAILERETRREKNLEFAKKQAEGKKAIQKEASSRPATAAKPEHDPEQESKFEQDFFEKVGIEPAT